MPGHDRRVVLITGASSGIGRLTAELFAREGWHVAATARDPAALAYLGAQPNTAPLRLDVVDRQSIASAVADTVARFRRIDVLVNNAGYGVFGPLEGTTPEQVEEQFRTNVIGAIEMIRAVLPVMRAQKGGTIINVSSIAGRIAVPVRVALSREQVRH